MRIFVVRHGETDANKNFILQGAIDLPLNSEGFRLAKITGEKFKGIKFDICYSSPQIRAIQTAETILKESDNPDTPIIKEERIKEYYLGDWEGKSYNPEKKEVNLFRLWLFNKNPRILGAPNGEKCKDIICRTTAFLNELKAKDYDNVLVSSHGGASRALLNSLYENSFDFWQGSPPPNLAVNIVDVINGRATLVEKDKIYYDKKYLVDRYNVKDLLKNKYRKK